MGSRRGPGRNGGPMMHALGGRGHGGTPYRGKPLGRALPWTTAALPDLRAAAAAAYPATHRSWPGGQGGLRFQRLARAGGAARGPLGSRLAWQGQGLGGGGSGGVGGRGTDF